MSDKPNHHKPWMPSASRKLVRMVQAGKSWDEIAAALGRGVPACKTRFQAVRASCLYEMRRKAFEAWDEHRREKIMNSPDARKAALLSFWNPPTQEEAAAFFTEYFKNKEHLK
jgi:hypothetical protein